MLGAPGKRDYIDMGGMFTIFKVRENLTSYDDPGWYENPPGTLASWPVMKSYDVILVSFQLLKTCKRGSITYIRQYGIGATKGNQCGLAEKNPFLNHGVIAPKPEGQQDNRGKP